jgi:hypothetical protein
MIVLEELYSPVVFEAVNHVLEDVDIAAVRYGLEKVPRHHLATMRQVRGLQPRCRRRCDVGPLDEDPLEVGVGLEERDEEVALPAPDIDHPGTRGEVIGGHHGRSRPHGPISHSVVEPRGGLGVVRPVVIDAHAEDLRKRGRARVHTVEYLRPHAVRLFPVWSA